MPLKSRSASFPSISRIAVVRVDPLTFIPLIKRARWGGTRLATDLGKSIDNVVDAAESWEICDHGADQSIVAAGPHAGRTLSELLHEHAVEITGAPPTGRPFPLLVKYLDVRDILSLQVHPDDAYAAIHTPGERGKNEAWLILDAEPGAYAYMGLQAGVTRSDLEQALTAGDSESLNPLLHRVSLKAGDVAFIPAGTIHALGPGLLLAEVQQSSVLTYRLSDWGRVGSDGRPRELHLRHALACTDFNRGPVSCQTPALLHETNGNHIERLVSTEWFDIERHSLSAPSELPPANHVRIVMQLQGSLEWATATAAGRLERGAACLLPASVGVVTLTPGPDCQFAVVCP